MVRVLSARFSLELTTQFPFRQCFSPLLDRCPRRYLDMLFQEHVGVSPKSLASILRFQEVYQGWMQHKSPTFFSNHWPAYYYDQSHFIKEFKRFTGFTPQHYAGIVNEFGRAFSAGQ